MSENKCGHCGEVIPDSHACYTAVHGEDKGTRYCNASCAANGRGHKPGHKHDAGKPRYELIPPSALDALAKVLTHGAEKYGPNDWQGLDRFQERYYGAALRHLNAWREGEAFDADSGLHHLEHALCNIAFLVWQMNMLRQREWANLAFEFQDLASTGPVDGRKAESRGGLADHEHIEGEE